jgi:urea transport system substrate-binding protein
VPGQHHARLTMYIAQARGSRFEIVQNLGAIDPQEPLVAAPALTT